MVFFTYSYRNRYIELPSSEAISQQVGFPVLLPDFPGYKTTDIKIIEKTENDKALGLYMRNAQKVHITLSQSLKLQGHDHTSSITNLYGQFHPQEVYISTFKGHVLDKPSNERETKATKLLTWDDNSRHVNMWITPATSMTNAEAANLASTLYK